MIYSFERNFESLTSLNFPPSLLLMSLNSFQEYFQYHSNSIQQVFQYQQFVCQVVVDVGCVPSFYIISFSSEAWHKFEHNECCFSWVHNVWLISEQNKFFFCNAGKTFMYNSKPTILIMVITKSFYYHWKIVICKYFMIANRHV